MSVLIIFVGLYIYAIFPRSGTVYELVFDNKYIKSYGSENGRYKTTIYKIVEEINIEELINNIKDGIEVKEENMGIIAIILIYIIPAIILYFIIKFAVKNAIKESLEDVEYSIKKSVKAVLNEREFKIGE